MYHKDMSSQAVRNFCSAAREAEILQAHRKRDKQQACAVRKAAEQLLVETLGTGARVQTIVDDAAYIVRVVSRETQPSFTSHVVDKMTDLWQDPDLLNEKLKESFSADSPEGAVADLLMEMVSESLKRRSCLELVPLKKSIDQELPLLDPACQDIASALVRARQELKHGKEEHQEESKRIQNNQAAAEQCLSLELSQLGPGQVKRVNMTEPDGTNQAYYLRLKRARVTPKRKISSKALRKHILAALVLEATETPLNVTLKHLSSAAFGYEFIARLKLRLQNQENPPIAEEDCPPRVALDRIRMPKVAALA